MAAVFRTLSVLTAFAVVLAGCSGGGDAGPAATSSSDSIVVPEEPAEDGGSVEGTVVDDEAVPVAGATVGLVELSLEALTADDGTFAFRQVPPGTYKLAAQKLGYEASARSVDIVTGEVVTVTMQVVALAIEEGFHNTQERAGAMLCGAAFRIPPTGVLATRPSIEPCGIVSGTGTAADDQFIVNFQLTAGKPKDMKSLVAESQWTPSQALSKGLQVYWENYRSSPAPGFDSCPCLQFAQIGGTSPLRLAIDEDNITRVSKGNSPHFKPNEPGRYRARTFPYADALGPTSPADAALYVNQGFRHYATEFYFQPAPEGFTVLTDR